MLSSYQVRNIQVEVVVISIGICKMTEVEFLAAFSKEQCFISFRSQNKSQDGSSLSFCHPVKRELRENAIRGRLMFDFG